MNERYEAGTTRHGFVLPVVVFGLVLMSAVAVAALLAAGDETIAARAMRESSTAFYAAEAGLNEVYANWDDVNEVTDTMSPGTSVTFPWRDLEDGTSYRATVHRWDNGGQPSYELEVVGRTPRGQRTLSYALTAAPGGPGSGYSLGGCCRAAVTMRGSAAVEEGAGVIGYDSNPDGWGEACEDPPSDDRPGIIMEDVTELEFDEGGFADGQPPVQADPTLDDDDFDDFGGLSWDDIKGMADHVIGDESSEEELHAGEIGPSYNADGSCNTNDPLNWGSPDPNDACFGYFPIILITGEVKVYDNYGQGIFILDYDESLPVGEKGSELDFEEGTTINGLVLGKGCVEVEENAQFHGGMFVDGNYRNEAMCNKDTDFAMNDGQARINWSRCAVDRAIVGAGLEQWADVENPGGLGGVRPLGSRAFGELLR